LRKYFGDSRPHAGGGVPNSLAGIDALDREFNYDPIYRLLTATDASMRRLPDAPWRDDPKRKTRR
jgi:hypothetical protein